MSWWNPLDWVGEIGSLAGTGQTTGQLQATGDALDAKLAELNKKQLDNGQLSPEQFQLAEQDRLNGMTGDVQSQVNQAAAQGAVEGLQSLPGKVTGALNKTFGWSLSFIPWWGWAGLVLVGFWYLGGFVYLRGIIARKAK